MISTNARLEAALKGPRFALIGAGQLGEMTLAMWPSSRPKPEFFVDTVKTGALAGLPVHDLKTHTPVAGVVYLLSAFKLPTRDVKAIFEKLGQPLILTVYDLFEETTPGWFSNGWRNLTPDEAILGKLASLPGLYADDLSAQAVKAAVAWRYQRELLDDYPVGPESAKYDLSLFGRSGYHYDHIFDAGSFDLALMHYLDDNGITFDRYTALEPDPKCLAACLAAKAVLPSEKKARVQILQAAISDHERVSRFMASGLLSARLLETDVPERDDEIALKTTTLSALAAPVAGKKPKVLIKLHIEGAELPALEGARALIEHSQSDILVNLSHNEKQFLDVPAFLAEFGSHDIFLRSHSLFGEGLTLFARYRP